MRPLTELPDARLREVRGVFTDVDDTLTSRGRLTAAAYMALERLHDANLRVVPVTGGPAGWCDLIARIWPVDAVIGENGAFYFRYDRRARRLQRRFVQDEAERERNRGRLQRLRQELLAAYPNATVAPDQGYRECDLAIDHGADVTPLSEDEIAPMVAYLQRAGATAKVSSIHINAWFGDYDKRSTARLLAHERFGESLDDTRSHYLYVGDAPNDMPMFDYFPLSVGVANIRRFAARLRPPPAYVTESESGAGFVELTERLLAARERAA